MDHEFEGLVAVEIKNKNLVQQLQVRMAVVPHLGVLSSTSIHSSFDDC